MSQKGSLPQKGHKLPQIGLSCLSGGDTLKLCLQSKFDAKRLKIAPFMSDRTPFWDPKHCPFPIGPFDTKIRNLGPYQLLDIITEEKPAKFQIKWTTASKVMRHRNFVPRKGSALQKGNKLAPNWNILFSRWRYREIMCTVQISSETV